MPVESYDVGDAPANVTVEQDNGPFTVERDMSRESTAVHEVEVGNDVVTADWHDQTPSGAFEQGAGESVSLDWLARPEPGDGEKKKAQTKVVSAPESDKPSATDGAETK